MMITMIVMTMASQLGLRDLSVSRTGLAIVDVVGATTHGGMKCQQASSGDRQPSVHAISSLSQDYISNHRGHSLSSQTNPPGWGALAISKRLPEPMQNIFWQ
jgi:hypothetical protein